MPSERRLHPVSIVFALGDQVRAFALPGIAVLFTAGSAGWGWQGWMMLLLIPYAIGAVGRYWSFRYRYEDNEMVIRTGLVFRNERHVPYARIQNLDAVQNVLHRMLGVVEVRVETGAGQEPEATMRVLPVAALEEMRAHVFAERATPAVAAAAEAPHAEGPRTLLHLSPRALLLSGFIQNRGAVLIAAGFGLLWEFDLFDRWFGAMSPFEDGGAPYDPDQIESVGRGVIRQAVDAVFSGSDRPLARVALAVVALAGLLVFVRLLSMAWAFIQLYDFRLTRSGDDLRAEYGLLTRVAATVPLRRIQTMTVREGVLHRLFGYTSVRVDTAGGDGGKDAAGRAWLAPIIEAPALPALVQEILPGVEVSGLQWRHVHPRAFWRRLKVAMTFAAFGSIVLAVWLGLAIRVPAAWALLPAMVLLPAAVLQAWFSTAHLRWALTSDAVAFKSGWLWRHVTVARIDKLQAVALRASPFDRRAGMATVQADTAGAGAASHRIVIPYLPRDVGRDLHAALARQAGETEFTW
jgi:putative membrane protein